MRANRNAPASRIVRRARQLALPLACSLSLHLAVFYGWHSPLLYASIERPGAPINARLLLAPERAPTDRWADFGSEAGPEALTPPQAVAADPVGPAPAKPQAESAEDVSLAAADTPAAPLGTIEPDYPQDPELHKLEGRVILRLLINERGAVDRVIVEDTGALPAAFGDVAAAAFLAARFDPARKAGAPVNSQMRIEVQFGATR